MGITDVTDTPNPTAEAVLRDLRGTFEDAGVRPEISERAAQRMFDRILALATPQAPQPDKVSVPGVDDQVMLAATMMSDDLKRKSPQWLWHENDTGKVTLGRWCKHPEQAPYVRADLVAAPQPDTLDARTVEAAYRDGFQDAMARRLWEDEGLEDAAWEISCTRRDLTTAPQHKDACKVIGYVSHHPNGGELMIIGPECYVPPDKGWIAVVAADEATSEHKDAAGVDARKKPIRSLQEVRREQSAAPAAQGDAEPVYQTLVAYGRWSNCTRAYWECQLKEARQGPLYAAPRLASDDARDAGRYRALRATDFEMPDIIRDDGFELLSAESLDAVIDAAIARQAAGEAA